MRPIRIAVSAPGPSVWVPIDNLQVAFGIGICVIPSSDFAGSFTVQHSFDYTDGGPGNAGRTVAITRTTTTATVTDTGAVGLGHGLSTGDSVIIKGAGAPFDTVTFPGPQPRGDIGATITVTGPTTYTYTVANSGPTTASYQATSTSFRVFPHATIVAATARVDGNYAFPPQAIRLLANTLTAGFLDMFIVQGMGH